MGFLFYLGFPGPSRREMTRMKEVNVAPVWPAEGVAMAVLITTSVLSFLLVGAGLGVTSWYLLKQTGSHGYSDSVLHHHHGNDHGLELIDDMEYSWDTGTNIVFIV